MTRVDGWMGDESVGVIYVGECMVDVCVWMGDVWVGGCLTCVWERVVCMSDMCVAG